MKSLIRLQNKLCRCAMNQNCGFIRTYGGQIFRLIIHLCSLTFVLYNRQVPISNLSAFFSRIRFDCWLLFLNLNIGQWRRYDVIILKKQFFSLEKLNKYCNWNKFLSQILKNNVGFCLLSSRTFEVTIRHFSHKVVWILEFLLFPYFFVIFLVFLSRKFLFSFKTSNNVKTNTCSKPAPKSPS